MSTESGVACANVSSGVATFLNEVSWGNFSRITREVLHCLRSVHGKYTLARGRVNVCASGYGHGALTSKCSRHAPIRLQELSLKVRRDMSSDGRLYVHPTRCTRWTSRRTIFLD